MPLTLSLNGDLDLPVDVTPLRLGRMAIQSSDEVARTKIWYGNSQVSCAELFTVSGDAADQTVVFQGDCSRVKSIGAGLSYGAIRVEGNAGAHLGAQMTGGHIIVSGDAGDWVGAEMRNGTIEVHGNCGHHPGGSYPGSKKGMRGGEIRVLGNAGNDVGCRQRRGLIAIAGDAGTGTGFGMLAGTICVAGRVASRCGAGMKRGSLILLDAGSASSLFQTFRYATTGRPTFLQLYFKHLLVHGFPIPAEATTSQYRVYRGDFLESGKGEALCRVG